MAFYLLWAVVPPLLLLVFYYRRASTAPPLPHLLLCFGFGALSGLVALGGEWGFEQLASSLGNWDKITRSLVGVALRQIVEVGPIEEGCKLGGVVLFQFTLKLQQNTSPQPPLSRGARRKERSRPITTFLFTIAIALGFTAQENWLYLANETASVSDRLVGTPVHAMFSAPWGYALARNRRSIARAWVNAVVCHALVNVLSSAWRYSPPLSFLSYGLFPFLLWMFWRLEGLLRRVLGLRPIILVSAVTPIHRSWQLGLVLFALMLGGNALFGFFLLARSFSALSPFQLFYPDILWFVFSRCLLNLIPGLMAGGIYWYLRCSASR